MAVPPLNKYRVRFKSWFRRSVVVEAHGVEERERFFVFFGPAVAKGFYNVGAFMSTNIFDVKEVSSIRMMTPLYGDARNIVGATHA